MSAGEGSLQQSTSHRNISTSIKTVKIIRCLHLWTWRVSWNLHKRLTEISTSKRTSCHASSSAFGEQCFHPLAWLRKRAFNHMDESKLVCTLHSILDICHAHNPVISVQKSTSFTRGIQSCGHVMNAMGELMDSKHYEDIMKKTEPKTTGDMGKYINYVVWMSKAIIRFGRPAELFCDVFETAYKNTANGPR